MLEQQLRPEKNGKHPQPLLPVYTPTQENKTDEWDLRHLLAVVRRRAAVIGSVAIALSATVWVWTLTQEAEYEGKFRLLVEPVTTESKLSGLTQSPDTINNLQQLGLDYETQIQVLQSPEIMAPIVKQLSIRYPDINYDSLLGNLQIARFQETKILEVQYQDSDPQKIQVVLQALAKGYLKYSLQERQNTLGKGVQFVNSQLPDLQLRVNNLQKNLQQFRQKYNFIEPEVKAGQLSEQADTIKLQRLDTQNQLSETRTLYGTLKGQSGTELAKTRTLNGAQLVDIESQIAIQSALFRQDSPTIRLLREKRDKLLPVLQQEAERSLAYKVVEVMNQIASLEKRLAQVTQVENSLNKQIKELPTLTRQYTDLQRELRLANDSLNRFLAKRQSLQVETAQKEIPWQLIAAPQLPQVPVSPNVKRNLILGAITGILAGIAAALLVERLDNVFHSLEDLAELTKLPLLGVIPFHKNLKQLALTPQATVVKKPDGYNLASSNIPNAQGESYFLFLEAFRSLHTNIGFLGSDAPINSVVISSSVHGEGKSTVALHLAQASAAMGRRVLLVDADLRLPQVHTLLDLPNQQGLSNVIATNLSVLEVIQRSPLSDNLFVLTSGQIPPDPTKLLSSKKMQNIMELLRQHFDLVIYDTPPFLGLADGSLLAKHTSGIVLVTRIGKTDRSLLIQALEQLRISRAAVLGTVCNGVKNYNNSDSGYYYYRPRNQSDRPRNQSVGLK